MSGIDDRFVFKSLRVFISKDTFWLAHYRTLHSYNLIWAVCHLFPQQTIGQENHVTCLKLRPCKFHPAFFGADSKTRIFYKYVIFKHSLFPNFHCSADTLSPVWLPYWRTEVKSQKKKKKWISLADIHFFKTLLLADFFQSRRNRLFRTTRKNIHFKYVINLNRTLSLLTFL